MSKFKVLERQGQIGIRCKLGSGEQINSNEVMYFSQNAIRGIMQPTVEGPSSLIYIGAQGVPLSRFLKHIISKEHYFMIAAQLVEIYKTAKLRGLDPNWLVLDPDYIVINETSGEMSFIHSAIFTQTAVNDGFIACFNRIANATSFTTQEDYNAVGEFLRYINGLGAFSVNDIDNYIRNAVPATYAAIPHQEYTEPAAPQPTAPSQPVQPAAPAAPAAIGQPTASPAETEAVPAPAALDQKTQSQYEEFAPPKAEEQEAPVPAAAPAEPVQAAEVIRDALSAEPKKPEITVSAEPAPTVTSEEEASQPVPAAPAAVSEPTAPTEPEKPEVPAEPEKTPEPAYTAKLVRRSNGEEIVISKPVFRIGKERAKVDYCITDNNTVSRVHATIFTRGGKCYAADNNSTNRTFINGSPVPVQIEMPLNSGDVLKFSNEEFDFIG